MAPGELQDREREALLGVRRALAALHELDSRAALLSRGLEELCRHCGFDRALMFRIEGDVAVGWAIWFAQRPEWAAELLQLTTDVALPLTHLVLETEMMRRRAPALVSDPWGDPRAFQPLTRPFETRSYVAAPLMPGGRVIGFLHADRYFAGEDVDEVDRDALATFAEGFGYALHRAVLLDRLAAQRAEVRQMLAATEAVLSRGDDLAFVPVDLDGGGAASIVTSAESRAHALLTPRELEVLALMADGASNADISRRLVIAEGTVKTHVKHVLRKLRAGNRAEAVARYHRIAAAGR